MEKKLPKIFANKINKKLENNSKIYVSKSNDKLETEQQEEKNKKQSNSKQKISINKTVNQKIKEIMNTKKYVYKIPVIIELKDKEITTNIIGKNNKNIITIDNELIKIEDIKNIEIQKKNE